MNLVGGSSAGRQFSRREKKKKVQKSHTIDPKQSKPLKVDKSQIEYFFCKKLGHEEKNYPVYIAILVLNRSKNKRKRQVVASQGIYMIIPYNFSVCNTTIRVLDTRSPINICNLLQKLQVSKKF